MRNFCTALDRLPGQIAVLAEWEQLTADAFPLVKPFLDLRGTPARSIPCRSNPPCRCRHEVVESSSGAMEAVCRCESESCPAIPINQEDTFLYGLNTRRLAEALARAMKLDPSCSPVHGMPWAFHVADCWAGTSAKFPVYLLLPPSRSRFERAVLAILRTSGDPPILLYPTETVFSAECGMAIERAGALPLVLSDAIARSDGRLVATDYSARELRRLAERHKAVGEGAKGRFPTPPGADWSDVSICFVLGDTIEVAALGTTRLMTCRELGLENARTKKPREPWLFLQKVAENHGGITPKMGNYNKNKDWKNQLTDHLRRIFGLDDDPFFYDPHAKSWTARFHIEP